MTEAGLQEASVPHSCASDCGVGDDENFIGFASLHPMVSRLPVDDRAISLAGCVRSAARAISTRPAFVQLCVDAAMNFFS